MINTLIGTKSNMSAIFSRSGQRIPVTGVVATSNIIIDVKNSTAIIGFGRRKKSKKTDNAIVKAVGYTPRVIKEVWIPTQNDKPQEPSQENPKQSENTNNKIKVGDKITVSIFKVGDMVKISGTTKGKGFAGGVKRWGFAGGPKTHGQSDRHRAPGSIGAGTTPGRVFKGKKMAGHMGNAKLTVGGLEVIEVDEGKNLLFIKGAIPGPKSGVLIIEKVGEFKNPSMTAELPAEVTQVSEDEKGKEKKEEEVSKVAQVSQEENATTESTEKKTEKGSASEKSESVNSVVTGEEQNAS